MKKVVLLVCLFILLFGGRAVSQQTSTSYVTSFENVNHPEVAYWFFAANMMPEERYKAKIDSFVKYSKYTLIFLTERDGCNFHDHKTMHPVFEKLVKYAHQKGLKIGLQIWKDYTGTLIENTDRLIQDGEVILDENGKANYQVNAKGARDSNSIIKSELFKIYAFKKTGEGFYDPNSLNDITNYATSIPDIHHVSVSINAGATLKGYTAFIETQHYYKSCSNFSKQAYDLMLNDFKAYGDIPFDGIGLDEYKNMLIDRQPVLAKAHDVFRSRLYSLGMAKKMKELTGKDMEKVLFDMRYAPTGKSTIRMVAINEYMRLLRTATLGVDAAVYDLGKKLYGKDAFIGLHSTFHNNLDKDEVWQTGVSWWDIKRDYGHTDENTATAIQLGIGMSYKKNAMYNMYYDKSLDKIWTKALYDLRFGIRTHYHAANDVQGWGVSIDAPSALIKINPVERAARLLNRFNPAFPNTKLLVVYGMEAIYNWYPNYAQRGMYDINDFLGMEKKSIEMWQNGYIHAAVPTDLINDGRLKINAAGKPELNGYTFDAVVLLNPEYATEATTKFFQTYINNHGKLLVEGNCTHDFYGNDVSATWEKIIAKATATSYSLNNFEKLGIEANKLVDGINNEPGAFTFTNVASLSTNSPATFSFSYAGKIFTGTYKGLAAIKIDSKGNLIKLAATGFGSITKDGKEILSLSKEADVFIIVKNGVYQTTIADDTKTIKVNQKK
jgi:hypothetical protein